MILLSRRIVPLSLCVATLLACTSTATVGDRDDAGGGARDVAATLDAHADTSPVIDVLVARDIVDASEGGDACTATEVCDGVDNDCDGAIDEGFCRIGGACFTNMQRNPANACQQCAPPAGTVSGPTAWSNVAASTECRASTGPCDPAEACVGDGSACPANLLAPAGGRTYTRGASPLTFLDACAAPGSHRVLVAADQAFVAEALPFSYRFFGNAQTVVVLAVNGMVSFSSAVAAAAQANTTLPAPTLPDTVFALWDDLETRAPGVCIATLGAAPDRRWVAEWRDAGFCCGAASAAHLDFEVVLTESSHLVDVLYRRLDDPAGRATGNSATVGLQGADAATFDLVSFNVAGAARAGSGLRWTPRPAVVCRPSAGLCDPDETCNGTSAACPADTLSPASLCRPSAGPCDAVERCTASGAACPPDGFAPTASSCSAGLACTGAVCCAPGVTPGPESCNGVDDDCNGVVDDGVTRDCYAGAPGTAGVGACRLGVQACAAGVWGACGGAVLPVPEVCNGVDDNCNGTPDDGIVCP